MERLVQGGVAAMSLGAIIACGLGPTADCDPPVPPNALYVLVTDSVTNQPRALGTIGTADAPGVHDTLIAYPPDSLTLYSRSNAPGTYTVRLRREGYFDWVATGVEVAWGRCGGGNVRVVARLQPLAP